MKKDNDSIEKYIDELKIISEKMKRPDIPVDDAVSLYKRSRDIAEKAKNILNDYKCEIELLNEGRLSDE